MMKIRRSRDRGHADRGWLKAYFSFSFADYHDPDHMGFRALRVLNDDRIAPGRGFGPHAHRDMEIVTYVLEGRLLHRDSTGEERTIGPNEVQTMSAGTGIVHSEFNASDREPVHSIQIWILPASEDLEPAYQQIAFPPEEKRGRLRLLAGPKNGSAAGSTTIHQDARVYVAELGAADRIVATLDAARHGWLQVVGGEVRILDQKLAEGDGAAISGESEISIEGAGTAGGEVLFFDLA